MQFKELSLTAPLLKAVEQAGYTSPSPIQQKAIPPVLDGRDLLGCAQTGTGKTAAFALPILQILHGRDELSGSVQPKNAGVRPIRTLILTPTRELALQIDESFITYGKHLPLRSTVIFGGVNQGPQVAQLKRGVDILVATPGRLNDLIGQGFIKLDKLEIFVLDEADRMLDMGFVNDVKKVIKQIPQKRQTLLFSATMPDEIVALADSLLKDPVKVFVTPASTTVEAIEQTVYKVDRANKRRLLAHLLKTQNVHSALVFTRTKHGADRVVRELKKAGITGMAIHGNKSQNARQDALARFKDGRIQVLIATDIAARGLDISELSHVFNYDLPNIPETYVHRIGRTGRAGHAGIAISFCSADELPYLADIEKLARIKIPEVTDHAWPMVEGPTDPKAAANNRGGQNRQTQPAKQTGTGRTAAPARENTNKKKGPAAQPEESAPMSNENQSQQGRQNSQNRAGNQGGAANGTAGGNGGKKRSRRRGPRKPMPQENPYENRTGGQAIVTRRPPWSDGGEAPAQGGQAAGQNSQQVQGQRQNQNQGQNVQSNGQPRGGRQQGQPQNSGGGQSNQNGQNRRRGRGKGGSGNPRQETPAHSSQNAQNLPKIPKNEKGLFDFSEEELSKDDSLRLISTNNNTEQKYASFEDFLKDHE